MSFFAKMAGASADVARGVAQSLQPQKGGDAFQAAAIDSVIATVGSFCGAYPSGTIAVEVSGHVGLGSSIGNVVVKLDYLPPPPPPPSGGPYGQPGGGYSLPGGE